MALQQRIRDLYDGTAPGRVMSEGSPDLECSDEEFRRRILFDHYSMCYNLYMILVGIFGEDNVFIYGGFVRDTLLGIMPRDIDFRVQIGDKRQYYGAIAVATQERFNNRVGLAGGNAVYCESLCGEIPELYKFEAWSDIGRVRDKFGRLATGISADIVCYSNISAWVLDYDVNGLIAKMTAPVDGGRAWDCLTDVKSVYGDKNRVVHAILKKVATPVPTDAYNLTQMQKVRLAARRRKMIDKGFTIVEDD